MALPSTIRGLLNCLSKTNASWQNDPQRMLGLFSPCLTWLHLSWLENKSKLISVYFISQNPRESFFPAGLILYNLEGAPQHYPGLLLVAAVARSTCKSRISGSGSKGQSRASTNHFCPCTSFLAANGQMGGQLIYTNSPNVGIRQTWDRSLALLPNRLLVMEKPQRKKKKSETQLRKNEADTRSCYMGWGGWKL